MEVPRSSSGGSSRTAPPPPQSSFTKPQSTGALPQPAPLSAFDHSHRLAAEGRRGELMSSDPQSQLVRGSSSSSRMTYGAPTMTITGPPPQDHCSSRGVEAEHQASSAKMAELTGKLQELEDRLQRDFSMSEASKYAAKKEIAKTRANIMRLKRSGEAT
jgi:outer membrane murein-binding lipoprotein Lpp